MQVHVLLFCLAALPSFTTQDTPSCPTNEDRGSSCNADASETDSEDDVGFIQVASVRTTKTQADQRKLAIGTTARAATCAPLTDHGSFFSIPVVVGTPGQTIDVVVDTGSDALVVADCKCIEAGLCKTVPKGKCVDMSADSTSNTLLVLRKSDGSMASGTWAATMSYGSGTITTVISTDTVLVADITTVMKAGVYLMQDATQLTISGNFEGIFGLGVPGRAQLGGQPLWAQVANVARYSVCFNDKDKEGTLVANHAPFPDLLPQIGSVHWGLEMHGMSVGDEKTAPVLFCSSASKTAEMDTACGAIPDSGTTLFQGPAEQIHKLHIAICDQWPRCQKEASDSNKSHQQVFHDLLYNCGEWLTDDGKGVDELPPINLHLAGKGGEPHSYSLSPWRYILQTTAEVFEVVTGKLYGVPIEIDIPTGKTAKTCLAAFGAMEMITIKNGPVWIMGTPLFFEYKVGFDISTEPASISIVNGTCTKCGGAAEALLSEGSEHRHSRRNLRFIQGPLRDRALNTSSPDAFIL